MRDDLNMEVSFLQVQDHKPIPGADVCKALFTGLKSKIGRNPYSISGL